MNTVSAAARAAAVLAAGAVVLAGCSSDDSDDTSSSKTTSAAVASGSTTSAATTRSGAPVGSATTIAEYVKANDITETRIAKNDPDFRLDLKVPANWEERNDFPGEPYAGLVYTPSLSSEYPARIQVLVSKLTGDVDTQALLDLAPGELHALPGFQGPEKSTSDEFDGYPAVKLAGTFEMEGRERLVAQKTVLIPAEDGVYVMQMNALGSEENGEALAAATREIDDNSTITRK